jgi:aspartokinase-like uncharacterized kinase
MDAVVVKVGGSLALHPEKLKALCTKLNETSKKHKLIIVPGGGEFADAVRAYDKRFNLTPQTSHRMALLAMDQYGFALSDLMPSSCTVNKFEDLQKAWDAGRLPVLLPSNFLFSDDWLENSWDVTSDSIAVYIAEQLDIHKTVLVTDVDGVFTNDPKRFSDAKLIDALSTEELLKVNKRTSVDKFLPRMLLQWRTKCFVVNGLYPRRVEAVLNGQETICTQIN